MVLFCKPRVCGEKSRVCPRSDPGTESPPRMRGKESHARSKRQAHGITPAYAGKSCTHGQGHHCFGDHPRVCGEKLYARSRASLFWGSPPRMRGKGGALSSAASFPRITPACAGKSSAHTQKSGTNGDHPRMCGEKLKDENAQILPCGSPPHVRGKGERKRRHSNPSGITPACAGKSTLIGIL